MLNSLYKNILLVDNEACHLLWIATTGTDIKCFSLIRGVHEEIIGFKIQKN